MNFQITISSPVAHFSQLAEAYQETKQLRAFAQSVGSDAEVVTPQTLVSIPDDAPDEGFMKQLQVLTGTLNARKFDLVPQMTEELLQRYVQSLRRNYHAARSRMEIVTGLLSEAVLASGVENAKEWSLRLLQAQSVSDVVAAAHDVFSVLALASQLPDTAADAPVAKACAFIREHSSDANLSIPVISEHCGMTPQHLTRLFRKELGSTVAEYLNAQRIDAGKKLLVETELSIGTIAKQAGYNSLNAFVYNFRRFEGVTPTAYRELLGH